MGCLWVQRLWDSTDCISKRRALLLHSRKLYQFICQPCSYGHPSKSSQGTPLVFWLRVHHTYYFMLKEPNTKLQNRLNIFNKYYVILFLLGSFLTVETFTGHISVKNKNMWSNKQRLIFVNSAYCWRSKTCLCLQTDGTEEDGRRWADRRRTRVTQRENHTCQEAVSSRPWHTL